jgi:hypothetical protein
MPRDAARGRSEAAVLASARSLEANERIRADNERPGFTGDRAVTRIITTHNSHCISNIIVEVTRGSNGRSPGEPVTIKRAAAVAPQSQYRAKRRDYCRIAGRVAALIARFRGSHL